MKNGYPITVIRNEDRDEYYTALETAQVESNYELLADFIEKSVENTFGCITNILMKIQK